MGTLCRHAAVAVLLSLSGYSLRLITLDGSGMVCLITNDWMMSFRLALRLPLKVYLKKGLFV